MSKLLKTMVFVLLSTQWGWAEIATWSEPPERFEKILGIEGMPVVRVSQVREGTAAALAGLQKGDLIFFSNGRSLNDITTFTNFLAEMRIDAILGQADLEILRYEPENHAYYPAEASVVLRPKGNEITDRFIGIAAAFAYYVQDVPRGGLGQRIGIEPGDFIRSINGKKISDFRSRTDIDNALKRNPNEKGPITIELARWEPLSGRETKFFTREVQIKP